MVVPHCIDISGFLPLGPQSPDAGHELRGLCVWQCFWVIVAFLPDFWIFSLCDHFSFWCVGPDKSEVTLACFCLPLTPPTVALPWVGSFSHNDALVLWFFGFLNSWCWCFPFPGSLLWWCGLDSEGDRGEGKSLAVCSLKCAERWQFRGE